jgi:hypothetical protein
VVCDAIKLRKPSDFNEFINCLVAHGTVEEVHNAPSITLKSLVPHFGSGQAGTGDITLADAHTIYSSPSTSEPTVPSTPSEVFLRHFGPMLSTVLFLENRLAGVNPTSSFDYIGAKPTNEIQALHLDPEALREFRSEIAETFGKVVGLDSTRGGHLTIKVSDSAKSAFHNRDK